MADPWATFPVADSAGGAGHDWSSFPAANQTLPEDQQMGMARGLAHEALSGVPILGPLAGKGLDLANSYISGDSYADTQKQRLAQEADFEQRHPIASTAASIGGGVASMLPLGATGIGAELLGLTGGLPGMIAKGALSGAAIGGADAAVRGGDPTQGALYGGVGGAAGPIAGRAISTVAAPFVNTARAAINPAAEAGRVVGTGLAKDAGKGLTDAEMLSNPAASVMHTGDAYTKAIARSAANTSPEANQLLTNATNDVFTGQAPRLRDYINSKFNFPDAASQQSALEQAQKATNNIGYKTAYAAGDKKFPQGIWSGASDELDRLITSPDVHSAMQQAAKMLPGMQVAQGGGGFNSTVTFNNGLMKFQRGGGIPQFPDMQLWDLTYRNLRDGATAAFRQGQSTLGNSLKTQAQSLRSALDNLVPEYGAARSTAEQFFNAGNALEAGQNLASTSKIDINGLRDAMSGMNSVEKKLLHDGYLSQVIQNAGNSADRRNWIATLNNSETKRQAMDMALGPDSKDLQAYIHVENIMDGFRNAVQGNSTTARQLMELGLAGGVGSAFGDNPLADPSAFMRDALIYGGLRYGHGKVQERVAAQVARLLTSRDPGAVRAGMQLATRNQNMFNAIRNADAALGGIGGRVVANMAAAKQNPPQ